MAGTDETPGGGRSPHGVNNQIDTTTHHTTAPRRRMPPADPPDCYGTGRIKVPVWRYANAFNWARVSPRTCHSCVLERRCLQQQTRMRRG